jgi:hypothetical protein
MFIVLIDNAARQVATIIDCHAVCTALACSRSRSFFGTFGCATVHKRVRVRSSIPVASEAECARRTSRSNRAFGAESRHTSPAIAVRTSPERACRRRNSVGVYTSSRRLAWAYLRSRELLLAYPPTGRGDSLPADLATSGTRCVTTCRSTRRDFKMSWAWGDKWVSVLQSLSGTSPVVA